jgi:hypothetical protein
LYYLRLCEIELQILVDRYFKQTLVHSVMSNSRRRTASCFPQTVWLSLRIAMDHFFRLEEEVDCVGTLIRKRKALFTESASGNAF